MNRTTYTTQCGALARLSFMISRYVIGCACRQSYRATNFLKSDEYQVANMLDDLETYSSFNIAGRSLDQILPRLDALIMVLKTCKDDVCTHPWRTLHPNGKVNDLEQALDKEFDRFYKDQPKMWFSSCQKAYIAEEENQSPVKPYTEGQGLLKQEFDYANHWMSLT